MNADVERAKNLLHYGTGLDAPPAAQAGHESEVPYRCLYELEKESEATTGYRKGELGREGFLHWFEDFSRR